MAEGEAAAWYAIGAVARKTGLSVHTLRAWERRYGVVEPERSGGGTRLYSTGDIARLRLLRRATEAGHAISRVARLSTEELRALLRELAPEEPKRGDSVFDGRQGAAWFVEELLKAVELMDGERIHALLMRAVVSLPVQGVIQQVILPVLRQVGDRWAAGSICPANEHLFSVNVQRVLAWLSDSVPVSPGAPTAIVTTPAGQWHEIGSHIAAVLTAVAGWRVVFLGPNLPAEDIVRAVEITGADLVLLGATMSDEDLLMRQLRAVREALPGHVQVAVGGRGVEPFSGPLNDLGIELLADFGAMEKALERFASRPDRRAS